MLEPKGLEEIQWAIMPGGRVAHATTGILDRYETKCGRIYLVSYSDYRPDAKKCAGCLRAGPYTPEDSWGKATRLVVGA